MRNDWYKGWSSEHTPVKHEVNHKKEDFDSKDSHCMLESV